MKRKSILISIFLLQIIILLSGCETTKSLAGSIRGIAEGITKDAKNAWKTIAKADDWMRENLW